MAHKTWSADELSRLSFEDADAVFEAGIVHDLSQVPQDFLDRVCDDYNDAQHARQRRISG